MNPKMRKIIEKSFKNSIKLKQSILNSEELVEKIFQASQLISGAFKNGNKVLFCGNGGSAADAQHLAAEFSGRFYKDRKALPSEALHCNTSYLTAVGNDYGFEYVYSRMIEGIGISGDILVGISTSGNSKNIITAFRSAKKLGMNTVAFTGESGGVMKNYSDLFINVPSSDTPRIQESHILIGHIICEIVESQLF
jgi:D-sedoheptulose 7-phosphate isomerase